MRKIAVLLIEPESVPRLEDIEVKKEAMMKELECDSGDLGTIELESDSDSNDIVVMYNKKGKDKGKIPNRIVSSEVIYGPFIICRCNRSGSSEAFAKLDEKSEKKYGAEFGFSGRLIINSITSYFEMKTCNSTLFQLLEDSLKYIGGKDIKGIGTTIKGGWHTKSYYQLFKVGYDMLNKYSNHGYKRGKTKFSFRDNIVDSYDKNLLYILERKNLSAVQAEIQRLCKILSYNVGLHDGYNRIVNGADSSNFDYETAKQFYTGMFEYIEVSCGGINPDIFIKEEDKNHSNSANLYTKFIKKNI